MVSFQQSCDHLPLHLLLLLSSPSISELHESGEEELSVVGHAKLSLVSTGEEEEERAALVESVIVDQRLRGAGLGRMLMREIEKIARKVECNVLYLSTKDQVGFYVRLGFEKCPNRVSPLLSSSQNHFEGLKRMLEQRTSKLQKEEEMQEVEAEREIWMKKVVEEESGG